MSGPAREGGSKGPRALGPIEFEPIEGWVSGRLLGQSTGWTGALESHTRTPAPGSPAGLLGAGRGDGPRRAAAQPAAGDRRSQLASSSHLVLAHRQRLTHHSSCRSSVPSLAPSASVLAVSTPVSIDRSWARGKSLERASERARHTVSTLKARRLFVARSYGVAPARTQTAGYRKAGPRPARSAHDLASRSDHPPRPHGRRLAVPRRPEGGLRER